MSNLLHLKSPRRFPSGHIWEGVFQRDLLRRESYPACGQQHLIIPELKYSQIIGDNIFIKVFSTRKKKRKIYQTTNESYVRAYNLTTNSTLDHSG